MKTFLICGFPRSRTLWLSHFLSVLPTSICQHEATEFAGNALEFWANGEKLGCEYYGNSDSANVFVLPSLLAERPLTRTLWIERQIVEVAQSMKAAGMPFTEASARTLMRLRDQNAEYFDFCIPYRELEAMDTCQMLWEHCLPGVPFNVERWHIYHSKKICYSLRNPWPVKNYQKFLPWVQAELAEKTAKY
jgi:hypothetical protein